MKQLYLVHIYLMQNVLDIIFGCMQMLYQKCYINHHQPAFQCILYDDMIQVNKGDVRLHSDLMGFIENQYYRFYIDPIRS